MSKENLVKEIIRTKLSEAGMSSKFRKAVEEYKEVSLKLQDLYADRAKALEGYKKADGAEKEKYKAELSRIQKLVSPLQAQMEKAEKVFNKALLSEPEDLEEAQNIQAYIIVKRVANTTSEVAVGKEAFEKLMKGKDVVGVVAKGTGEGEEVWVSKKDVVSYRPTFDKKFSSLAFENTEDLEEAKAMDMSEDETLGVAETLAKAISKVDGVKCTVDMKTIEPAHFDLVMVVNGKKEEAGTFNIHSDGSVRNEAIGGVKYGTVDSSVSDFIRNLKRMSETVDKDGMERVAAGLPQTEEEPVTEGQNETDALANIAKIESYLRYIANDDKYKPLVLRVRKELDRLRNDLKKNESVTEATADGIVKDLDKVRGELLKKVAELVAKKKKLYSNVDISSPMSAEEKKLDKEIADTFSQINQLVKQKRDVKAESVTEAKFNRKNDKKIKELEAKLARIKGKTPADEGWRAAIRDDIERLKAESVSEGKKFGSKYDIGMGHMGSGVTVWNRLQKQGGDYKTIAHISDTGKVSFRDKSLPDDVKKYIEDYAKKGMNEMVNEARVTHGKEELHKLNGMSKKQFADRYKGDGVDIFFKDDDTAVVSNRTSNLVHHGKDGGKTAKLDGVSAVYGGLEGKFYTPENWKKVLHSVYKGKQVNVGTLNMKDEAKSVKVKKFDDVHIKSKNITGMVYAISGNNLVVRTPKGLVKATKDDVEVVMSDGVVKEGNAFGMAVTQAKKDGKKEFEFNGKTYKVKKGSIEENEKETISETINEVDYNSALASFNAELEKNEAVKKIASYYAVSVKIVVNNLQSKIKVSRYSDKSIKSIDIDFTETETKIKVKHSKQFKNEVNVTESDCGCGANITEAVKEPEVITKLRDIVNRRGYATVKDPVTKKNVKVDTFSASAIIQVYDAVNDTNKQKLAALSIPKMASVAFKLAK